jgi:AmmeMemoRadiSam system protein A
LKIIAYNCILYEQILSGETIMALSSIDKQTLLTIARSSIKAAIEGESIPPLFILTQDLERPSGTFVTLKIDDELRGCIGYIEPIYPLAQAVQETAIKAATEDPRFMPVAPEELDHIQIEISVLFPIEKVTDVSEIEIGKHGLVVELGSRKGLLLPQVATEYGWTPKEFLNQTSLKAGLSEYGWQQPGARISRFRVELFSEKDELV